ANHPDYADVAAADGDQVCKGRLLRFRTLSGICNDPLNPAMGSAGQRFARNVQFETTFPDRSMDQTVPDRHGGRIGLLEPDPQLISRKLFTRDQSNSPNCREGHGTDCGYRKAPSFNVLAAFWIQFMTHDWFSHLDEARNDQSRPPMDLGCASNEAG